MNRICRSTRRRWMAGRDEGAVITLDAREHMETCADCRRFAAAAEELRAVLDRRGLPSPDDARDRLLTSSLALRGTGRRVTLARTAGVVVVIAGLLAMAFRSSREIVLRQASAVLTGRRPEWSNGFDRVSGPSPQTAAVLRRLAGQAAAAGPRTEAAWWTGDGEEGYRADLEVQRALPGGRTTLRTFGAMAAAQQLGRLWRAHPDDPALAAAYLRMLCVAGPIYPRWMDGPPGAPRGGRRSPWPAQMVLEVAAAGARAEPGNAFFPTMAALAIHGEDRTAEALRLLHAASDCGYWNDYAQEEAEARWRLVRRALGDHGAWMGLVVGESQGSIAYPWEVVFRVGGLIRRDGAWKHRAAVLRLARLVGRSPASTSAAMLWQNLIEIGTGLAVGRPANFGTYRREMAWRRDRIRGAAEQARVQAPEDFPAFAAAQADCERFSVDGSGLLDVWRSLDAPRKELVRREALGLFLLVNAAGAFALAILLGLFRRPPLRARRVPALRWLWCDAPWLLRAVLLGLAPLLVLACAWFVAWLFELGLGMIGIVIVLGILMEVGASDPGWLLAWPARQRALVCIAALIPLVLMAGGVADRYFTGAWAGVMPQYDVTLMTVDRSIAVESMAAAIGAQLVILLSLLIAALIAVILRRGGRADAVVALRRTAPAFALVLAAGYVALVFVSAAAEARDLHGMLHPPTCLELAHFRH